MTLMLATGWLFATTPSSTHYGLNNYGFGSGGTGSSSSSTYKLNAISGETSNVQSTSTNFKSRPGNNNFQQADVPPAPTFTNPSSYYDKLKFIVNPSTNPSDTKFLIAISPDNFTTTYYVQNDDTISTTLVSGDYQTYTAWGGASGQLVVGLSPATTYKMKISAIQGNFTQTEFGPTASAATVAPSISFSMFTDSQPSAPFSTSFGNLLPATVTTSADHIWISLSTNADVGAEVYISSVNAGLFSSSKGSTITSASADLTSASSGYGAQVTTTTQTSGGPLSSISPFNVSGTNVGQLKTTLQEIWGTSAPITGGSGALFLKAKAASTTPESSDYKDTLTFTAAGSF